MVYIIIGLIAFVLVFLYCSFVLSSKCARLEEKFYQKED